MLESQNELKKLVSSLIRYYDTKNNSEMVALLSKAKPSSTAIEYDNWMGGITTYELILELEIETFIKLRPFIEKYCEEIMESAGLFLRVDVSEQLGAVKIVPKYSLYLNWDALKATANKDFVLKKIEDIQNLMISVSTGGPRIQEVEGRYKKMYNELDEWLNKLGIENPNQYVNLWDWHGRWSQEDLGTYKSRRSFVPKIYEQLIDAIKNSTAESVISEYEPTGWERVDRAVYEMKVRLNSAMTEEQFQAIGMLGRETLITIAQQVFDPIRHETVDGINPSITDAKRMLEAYLNCELSGSSNERTRKFAKSAIDMANHLTHDRMATKRDSSMCLVSVTAVASLIKIIDESNTIDS